MLPKTTQFSLTALLADVMPQIVANVAHEQTRLSSHSATALSEFSPNIHVSLTPQIDGVKIGIAASGITDWYELTEQGPVTNLLSCAPIWMKHTAPDAAEQWRTMLTLLSHPVRFIPGEEADEYYLLVSMLTPKRRLAPEELTLGLNLLRCAQREFAMTRECL